MKHLVGLIIIILLFPSLSKSQNLKTKDSNKTKGKIFIGANYFRMDLNEKSENRASVYGLHAGYILKEYPKNGGAYFLFAETDILVSRYGFAQTYEIGIEAIALVGGLNANIGFSTNYKQIMPIASLGGYFISISQFRIGAKGVVPLHWSRIQYNDEQIFNQPFFGVIGSINLKTIKRKK